MRLGITSVIECGAATLSRLREIHRRSVEAVKQYLQAAADGHVQVWGKPTYSEIFEPIEQEFWRKYQIEWFSLLRGRTITEPAVLGAKRGCEYVDLMTSKAQVEALWPRKRRKVRLQAPWTFNNR
jgi:hypothetical protein